MEEIELNEFNKRDTEILTEIFLEYLADKGKSPEIWSFQIKCFIDSEMATKEYKTYKVATPLQRLKNKFVNIILSDLFIKAFIYLSAILFILLFSINI